MRNDILPPEHYTEAIAAEQALFGAVVLEPSLFDRLAEVVSSADYHQADLGRAHALLADLRASGKPTRDFDVVVAELRKAELLEPLGGVAAIGKIAARGVASTGEWSASEVRRLARLRRAAVTLARRFENCQLPKADCNEITEQAIAELQAIQHCDAASVSSLDDIIDATLADIAETRARGQRLGLPTGFHALDSLTGGFFPGELTVLAARPSIGKSAFALELAYQLATRGRSSLIVSLEMSRESISHRLLSRETGIPCKKIQAANLDEVEFTHLRESRVVLRGLPIRVMDPGSTTVAKIGARARVQIAQRGMDLLIVDYLGLVDAHDKRLSPYERVTAISRDFRLLAGELGRPILLLAQLNREAAKAGLPSLEHLRDSGAIEQDANNVWFLHRAERDSPDCSLIVSKQRQGEIATIEFGFDAVRMSFKPKGNEWQA